MGEGRDQFGPSELAMETEWFYWLIVGVGGEVSCVQTKNHRLAEAFTPLMFWMSH